MFAGMVVSPEKTFVGYTASMEGVRVRDEGQCDF